MSNDNILKGPTPYRVPVNQPFQRLPQCGCDSGSGPTFVEQAKHISELEAALRALCVAVREQDDVLDETPTLRRALLDAESWIKR